MDDYSVEELIEMQLNKIYNSAPAGTKLNSKKLESIRDILQFCIELSIDAYDIFQEEEGVVYSSVGDKENGGFPLSIFFEIDSYQPGEITTSNLCHILRNCVDDFSIDCADESHIRFTFTIDNAFVGGV